MCTYGISLVILCLSLVLDVQTASRGSTYYQPTQPLILPAGAVYRPSRSTLVNGYSQGMQGHAQQAVPTYSQDDAQEWISEQQYVQPEQTFFGYTDFTSVAQVPVQFQVEEIHSFIYRMPNGSWRLTGECTQGVQPQPVLAYYMPGIDAQWLRATTKSNNTKYSIFNRCLVVGRRSTIPASLDQERCVLINPGCFVNQEVTCMSGYTQKVTLSELDCLSQCSVTPQGLTFEPTDQQVFGHSPFYLCFLADVFHCVDAADEQTISSFAHRAGPYTIKQTMDKGTFLDPVQQLPAPALPSQVVSNVTGNPVGQQLLHNLAALLQTAQSTQAQNNTLQPTRTHIEEAEQTNSNVTPTAPSGATTDVQAQLQSQPEPEAVVSQAAVPPSETPTSAVATCDPQAFPTLVEARQRRQNALTTAPFVPQTVWGVAPTPLVSVATTHVGSTTPEIERIEQDDEEQDQPVIGEQQVQAKVEQIPKPRNLMTTDDQFPRGKARLSAKERKKLKNKSAQEDDDLVTISPTVAEFPPLVAAASAALQQTASAKRREARKDRTTALTLPVASAQSTAYVDPVAFVVSSEDTASVAKSKGQKSYPVKTPLTVEELTAKWNALLQNNNYAGFVQSYTEAVAKNAELRFAQAPLAFLLHACLSKFEKQYDILKKAQRQTERCYGALAALTPEYEIVNLLSAVHACREDGQCKCGDDGRKQKFQACIKKLRDSGKLSADEERIFTIAEVYSVFKTHPCSYYPEEKKLIENDSPVDVPYKAELDRMIGEIHAIHTRNAHYEAQRAQQATEEFHDEAQAVNTQKQKTEDMMQMFLTNAFVDDSMPLPLQLHAAQRVIVNVVNQLHNFADRRYAIKIIREAVDQVVKAQTQQDKASSEELAQGLNNILNDISRQILQNKRTFSEYHIDEHLIQDILQATIDGAIAAEVAVSRFMYMKEEFDPKNITPRILQAIDTLQKTVSSEQAKILEEIGESYRAAIAGKSRSCKDGEGGEDDEFFN